MPLPALDDLRSRVDAILGHAAATPPDRPLPPRSDRSLEARLARQEAAIDRLVRTHEALGRRVDALQAQSNDALSRLLRALRALDLRSKALVARGAEAAVAERVTRVRVVRQQRALRSALVDARIERVSSVVHATQRAAFGQKGSVFATNNLLLAGNELFWTFVGPALRALGAISASSATVASIIAPAGALATGQIVLGSRQSERFVSGVTTVTGDEARQSLRPFVAASFFSALERGPDLPVQLTPIDTIDGRLSGVVRNGIVIISVEVFELLPRGERVAWMVDLEPVLG